MDWGVSGVLTPPGQDSSSLIITYNFILLKAEETAPLCYGLFTLPDLDSDPYSDSGYCTMRKFPIGLDLDSDPLIEI